MSHLRSVLLTAAASTAAAVLLLPTGSGAEVGEVGVGVPDNAPSCPSRPCLAVSRTTGYQAKVGTNRGLQTVQKDGRLVSWTIALGKPGNEQIEFFNERLGGASQARITVLRPGRNLRHRVVSHGELVNLRPHFGTKVEFALNRTLQVRRGWIIALTVPTWAPALAVNLGGDTSWRAARERGTCDDTDMQTATRPGTTPQFFCLYRTARLTYSSRIITDPEAAEDQPAVAPAPAEPAPAPAPAPAG